MVDIGGGSTEIVSFEDGNIKDAVSLEIGSLYMYKNYVSGLFPDKGERKAIQRAVRLELKKADFLKGQSYKKMIGIGGTIRGVKKLGEYRFETEKEQAIRRNDLSKLIDECKDEERQLLKRILRVSTRQNTYPNTGNVDSGRHMSSFRMRRDRGKRLWRQRGLSAQKGGAQWLKRTLYTHKTGSCRGSDLTKECWKKPLKRMFPPSRS